MDAGDLLALNNWQRTTTFAMSYCSIKLTDETLITLNKEVPAVHALCAKLPESNHHAGNET